MNLLRTETRVLYGQLVDVKIYAAQPQRWLEQRYSVLPRDVLDRVSWFWLDSPSNLSYCKNEGGSRGDTSA